MEPISIALFVGIILIVLLEVLILFARPKPQQHECNYERHECKFRPEEIDIKFDFDRDFKHTHAPELKTGELYEFDSRVTDLIGQKIAVLCNRYHYRGILESAENYALVLSDATLVEQSGPAAQEVPTSEDPINGSVLVTGHSIELIHQVRWVNAPLPSEEDYQTYNYR